MSQSQSGSSRLAYIAVSTAVNAPHVRARQTKASTLPCAQALPRHYLNMALAASSKATCRRTAPASRTRCVKVAAVHQTSRTALAASAAAALLVRDQCCSPSWHGPVLLLLLGCEECCAPSGVVAANAPYLPNTAYHMLRPGLHTVYMCVWGGGRQAGSLQQPSQCIACIASMLSSQGTTNLSRVSCLAVLLLLPCSCAALSWLHPSTLLVTWRLRCPQWARC